MERRALLSALADGSSGVDRLVSATDLSPATVERHLVTLRANGFVEPLAGIAGGQYGLTDGVDRERW
ncbi:ArsR family transcriptional regulator [Halomarina oriensis]|uniref:ArsR family transcriptional regulator n=1 Tax=Halomarina oriensis TaxID=671145 RepID=A0A6B0GIU2_9EURY|nr:ArsR family transcriptional regulator [Halomarina oriensis]